MTRIKPCGYRVLLKPDEIEKVTKSGIVLAINENAERAGQIFGELVAVGDTAWSDNAEPWAKVGERVMYSKYSGKSIIDPDTAEVYTLINDVDVIAVVPATCVDDRNDGDVTV